MNKKIKVADYIVKYIEKLGVKHIFMLAGGGCIHLVDSFGKSKKIKYICNLHEQGVGIAAEAYSQYTNNIGVALVTTGPGSTNIITPIAGAWLDSIPMLVICGQVNTTDMVGDKGIRQNGFQEINMISLVQSITKYSVTVTSANDIKHHLDNAIFFAKNGRPGPVVLEIPLNIQSEYIDENTLISKTKPIKNNSIQLKQIVSKIIEGLKNSKRPIILAGNGIRLSKAEEEFNKFINKLNIPVLTTWKALDLLEETHPLYVGRPGTIASRGANFNQQNSDFIICLGARLDFGQVAYKSENFAPKAKKVIVDIDETEINKLNTVIDYKVVSDIKEFLKYVNTVLDKKCSLEWGDWLNHCKNTYNKYPVILKEYSKNKHNVNLYTFIDYLSDILPKDSLIIPGSSGACSEVTMQAIRIKKGMRIFNTEGLGAMGYGIPSSIGGCIASNYKKTICIEGDGSFFMNIQELELVKRLNLPIKFFVLNNGGYGSIKITQNNFFEGRLNGCTSENGLTLPSIKLNAKAYGIKYNIIKNHKNLYKKLKTIIDSNEAIICEIMIDKNHKTLPKTGVIKDSKGIFTALPMEDMMPQLPRNEFKNNIIGG